MGRAYLPIVLCLPVVLIWQAAVTSSLRALKIPSPLGRGSKESSTLTCRQYVSVLGVLQWGFGMFLFFECLGFIRWRYWADPIYVPSFGKALAGLVLWVIMGAIFGWIMWKLNYERNSA